MGPRVQTCLGDAIVVVGVKKEMITGKESVLIKWCRVKVDAIYFDIDVDYNCNTDANDVDYDGKINADYDFGDVT